MATFLSANIVQQAPPEGGATTRRKLLGGSAALAGAGALATVPSLAHAAAKATVANPDAALVGACARFRAIHAEICRIDETPNPSHWSRQRILQGEEELSDLVGRRHAIIFEIIPLAPRTAEGLRAKAEVARAVMEADAVGYQLPEGELRRHDLLAYALLNHILAYSLAGDVLVVGV